jgi:wyosine [tRNA(Phe)-imidazoG37] synthetase (radical SAM superfamily)
LLGLQKGIIYGPIRSRRLGSSLGINLLPTDFKLCSFNCIYCHYGWTKEHTTEIKNYLSFLPSVKEVGEALENWLKDNHPKIDYITFSGNGEPTLHPDFSKIVDSVKKIRDKYVPQAKVAILSNSSTVGIPNVKEGLAKLDLRIMKLDCGTEKCFIEINRPCEDVKFEDIAENLKSLNDFILQTIFLDGEINNISESEINEWIRKIAYLKPKEVQIYTCDRPQAKKGLVKVTKEKMQKFASQAQTATGIKVQVF